MSLYKHAIFRTQSGLNVRDEFLLSVIEQNQGHKSTTIRRIWKVDGMLYSDDNYRDSINKLTKLGLICRIYNESSPLCRLIHLTHDGMEYIKIVKSFYA